MATKISEKPWSDYSEADYTLAQWAAACLIKPAKEVTSKSQCKLPVRTPEGVLNRDGVHAAAAALAGARGGVDISPDQRSAVLKQVASLYRKLNEQVPTSVEHSAVDAFKETIGLTSLAHIAASTEKDMAPTTAVLVAVPSAVDPIRLVGDVDKHATLMFFGETSKLPTDAKSTMVKALSQVADLFHPFSEEITGIQRLGSDMPPALVAMLTKRSLGVLRDMLSINPLVTEYLTNAAQYPDYTAHVTLAYPDYAGEDPLRKLMTGLYQVQFDRLALWWGDERFEFDLARTDNSGAQLEMSEEFTNFLAHHGVKGMKWGVRKDSSGGGGGSTAIKGLKLAGKGAKGIGKGLEETGRFSGHIVAKGAKAGANKLRNNHTEKKIMEDQQVSKEAAKFIREHQGKGSHMSDQELRDMITRANLLTQYDALFTPKSTSNAELGASIEKLQLEAKSKQAKATISQAKIQKVNSLVKTSENAFEAYNKLNKASGGALNKKVALEFGQNPVSQLAREIRNTGNATGVLNKKNPGILQQTIKSVASSKDLRKQVNDLLDVGSDGSEQLKLPLDNVVSSKPGKHRK